MEVREVMTPVVVSVRASAPFKEVAETLLGKDISGVPVVDDAGFLVGIVTEADLLAKEAFPGEQKRGLARLLASMLADYPGAWRRKAEGLTAGDVMTAPVVTAGPDETIHVAARRMLEHGVKRLPVVEGGRLVGIVSRADLLRVFAGDDTDLTATITRFLQRCGYVKPEHEVSVAVTDGVATLEGTVLYESDIRVVGSLVGALDGVVGVENRLLYREPDPDPASLRNLERS